MTNKALLIISRDKVKFVATNTAKEINHDLEAFKNLEVINADLFRASIRNFLSGSSAKPLDVFLILDNDVIFSKEYKVANAQELKSQEELFISEVPISPGAKLTKTYDRDHKAVTTVVNRDIINNAQQALTDLKWNLSGVFPSDIITSTHRLTDLAIVADLKPEYSLLAVKRPKRRPPSKKLLLLIFGLLFVGAVLYALSQYYLNRQTPSQSTPKDANTVTDTTTTTETSQSSKSAEPKVESLPRNKLTIEIQNGSGVVGLAARIKTALEESKFTSISTRNAPQPNVSNTQVTFTGNVSSEDRAEIIKILQQDFKDIDQHEDDTSAINVIIVTGLLTR
jgi:hypothetical protein